MMRATTTPPPSWSELLRQATTEPGTVHRAYTAFPGYSLGNQLLALAQCAARGIEPGPIATFPRWLELGRHVRRGEKALTLCQPVTVKRHESEAEDETEIVTRFVFKPRWFVLSQTDGEEYAPPPCPDWDRDLALAVLGMMLVPFRHTDGNVQGYALPGERRLAINPLAAMPDKTLFHELGHVLLHAEAARHDDTPETPRGLREVEAEAVALLCTAALGLPGQEFSRGYIQNWWGRHPIPDESARRAIAAASKILEAGKPSA